MFRDQRVVDGFLAYLRELHDRQRAQRCVIIVARQLGAYAGANHWTVNGLLERVCHTGKRERGTGEIWFLGQFIRVTRSQNPSRMV